ncbi:type II CAAX prenyl endopeptidase Rce1 family protein [Mucilaginibacter lutimaris]|uniref:Type II CAAX prenyl endopeptidase Rce1 family protein n=1 Tax=Mucilaginibacter lutimaris TaxID=931629 RepID=A0ABW2Z9K6_9SPHI
MLKEFLAVNNYPQLNQDRSFQSKLILLLQIYGIIFLINILIAPISFIADHFVTHVLHYKSISRQYQETLLRMFHKFGYLKAVFYISVMAPVIEEAIFRLPLTFKRQHVAIAFGFALVLIAKLIPGLANQSLFINILARVALLVVGYFTLTKFGPALKTPGKGFQTLLIVTSVIVFGLMHILNYVPLQWHIIYIYPLYVIPQLMMGWALTYIRFKNGYFWGMGLHALINGVSMVLYTIFRHKLL